MNSSLCSDGWYRRVPVKTLDEWMEVQEICGCPYDQTFCKPLMNKIKSKRKAKYNIHEHRLTECTHYDRQTNSDNRRRDKQKTGRPLRPAAKAKSSIEK